MFYIGKKRNQYTKEYKTEAVRLIVEEGRPIAELARELGTAQSLLHRWQKKSEEEKVEPFLGQGRLSPEDEELRQLRRENKRLRMERHILKIQWPSSRRNRNEVYFCTGSLRSISSRFDVQDSGSGH
jgi:transposase